MFYSHILVQIAMVLLFIGPNEADESNLRVICPSGRKTLQVQISPSSTVGRLLAGFNVNIDSAAVACTEQGPCQNGGKEVVAQGYIASCDCPFGISTRYCEYQCMTRSRHIFDLGTFPLRKLESSRSRVAFTHRGQGTLIILAKETTCRPSNTMVVFGICQQGKLNMLRTVFDRVYIEFNGGNDEEIRCDGTGDNRYWIDFKDNLYKLGHIGDPQPLMQWTDDLLFDITYVGIFQNTANSMTTFVNFDIPCSLRP